MTAIFKQIYTPIGGIKQLQILPSSPYSMKTILQLCIDVMKNNLNEEYFLYSKVQLGTFQESTFDYTAENEMSPKELNTFLDSVKNNNGTRKIYLLTSSDNSGLYKTVKVSMLRDNVSKDLPSDKNVNPSNTVKDSSKNE